MSSMSSATNFRPDWLSAPGDTIADVLQERRLSVPQFAVRVDLTLAEARLLLRGERKITIALARRITDVIGGSVEFWISRDSQFQQQRLKSQPIGEEEWLRQLPLADMVKFGWLPSAPAQERVLLECLDFFGMPSLKSWHEAYGSLERHFAFRTSPSIEAKPVPVAAWLRRGEIEASGIDCAKWSPGAFRQSLESIRDLTRQKDPRIFLPELRRLSAASGVAVVVVRAPAGCRASGATRLLHRDKALLMLSARHLSDDQFWFSFFHEAGHLLLHASSDVILEDIDQDEIEREHQANEFAARILVPEEWVADMLSVRRSTNDLVRFARRIGISPGIVVGQLQHCGRIPRNHFNGLKRWYEWE